MIDVLSYLQTAHRQGMLVPFIGAGFGSAVANLPTWPKLLEDGIEYVVTNLGTTNHASEIALMRSLATEGHLIEAFDELAKLLRVPDGELTSIEYESFLAESFAAPTIKSDDLLRSLAFLQPARVITTNYDTLLESWSIGAPATITWQDASAIRNAIRLGSGVIHLHGVWNVPRSVILTRRSYELIRADRPARKVAQVLFHGRVVLFIGTSLDGVHDPHLADLLSEFEGLANPVRREVSPHVMLLKGRIDGATRARLNRYGILPVSYGCEYDDLPAFIRKIATTTSFGMSTRPIESLILAVKRAGNLDDAIRAVGTWITSEIYGDRSVRVSFSEKIAHGDGYELRRRAVVPLTSSGNPHHYPLSMSAWALVEGQPVSWPEDAARTVAFNWIRRLHKFERIEQAIFSPDADNFPELRDYADIDRIRTAFTQRTLTLGDFFQDWASDQPRPPYRQFLTVPVPWLDGASTRDEPEEHGVFNIDTLEPEPLLNIRAQELLRVASAATSIAFRLFGPHASDPSNGSI